MINPRDKFKKGDELIKFNIEKIKEAGYDVTTPVIITNSEHYKEVSHTNSLAVKEGEVLLSVQ
ncbi:MAG TPA: hypothetical protein DG753_10905 [Clostridium sp.]|nr:hypothetical protein [Clostridium sp.]